MIFNAAKTVIKRAFNFELEASVRRGRLDLYMRSCWNLGGRNSGEAEPEARGRRSPVVEDGRSPEYGPAEGAGGQSLSSYKYIA